ncbi:MAG: radical SAM protein [Alphaproteobacteria bacterium]|nr:radical SAM protein [Alphaproteobacteria bacterium]
MSAPWVWGEVSVDTVQVETTRECNLKCKGCLRTVRNRSGNWTNSRMRADLFALVLSNLPPCRILILNGTGEPMLNPDIASIVGLARASGKFEAITFNSNGLTADIAAYEALAQAGLSFLSISVDSLTQAVADVVRRGTKVEKLAVRLKELSATLSIPLTVTTVVSQDNLLDVPETLARLNDLGRFTVYLTDLSDVELLEGRAASGQVLDRQGRMLLTSLVEKSRGQFPHLDVILTQPTQREGERCPAPFRHPFIDAEGFLAPCCTLTDAHYYGRISIAQTPLVEALKMPMPDRWLADYAKAEPAACQGCQHAIRSA